MLNCHPPKPTSNKLIKCSTSQQTSSHLKHYCHHIFYLNLKCKSSLKSQLQGAPIYQISSFASKLVKSCAINPKKFYEDKNST